MAICAYDGEFYKVYVYSVDKTYPLMRKMIAINRYLN